MKGILHDLTPQEWAGLAPLAGDDVKVVSNQGGIRNCVGCFGCWVRTPGRCVIRDGYENMGEFLAGLEELLVISRCTFGGYSSFVKNVLDRSIPYILPFFEIREGEMHHRPRYENHIRLRVIFYGEDVTQAERETAQKLVRANALNLCAQVEAVDFVKAVDEIGEVAAW